MTGKAGPAHSDVRHDLKFGHLSFVGLANRHQQRAFKGRHRHIKYRSERIRYPNR